jgi:hypothetical protein
MAVERLGLAPIVDQEVRGFETGFDRDAESHALSPPIRSLPA